MVGLADSTVDPCFNPGENIECWEGGMTSSDPYAVTDSLDDWLVADYRHAAGNARQACDQEG
jgi:hypothetical protein